LLRWQAHLGPVVSIHDMDDGRILTTGGSGSVLLFDRNGEVLGGAMIEGGLAAARVIAGRHLVALRGDGWLVRYSLQDGTT
jgi:hypothetical protein